MSHKNLDAVYSLNDQLWLVVVWFSAGSRVV